jgi:hypothetical protein
MPCQTQHRLTISEVRARLVADHPGVTAVFRTLPKSEENRILRRLSLPATRQAAAAELSMLFITRFGVASGKRRGGRS